MQENDRKIIYDTLSNSFYAPKIPNEFNYCAFDESGMFFGEYGSVLAFVMSNDEKLIGNRYSCSSNFEKLFDYFDLLCYTRITDQFEDEKLNQPQKELKAIKIFLNFFLIKNEILIDQFPFNGSHQKEICEVNDKNKELKIVTKTHADEDYLGVWIADKFAGLLRTDENIFDKKYNTEKLVKLEIR